MKILTTQIIKGQEQYVLPINEKITLNIFNKKKGKWENREFVILIQPTKILKTDTEIKISLEE